MRNPPAWPLSPSDLGLFAGCMWCYTCTCHVTHTRVTSHIHESRHTCTCHVTHTRVTSHIRESRYMCECVMSHILHCCMTPLALRLWPIRSVHVMSHVYVSHYTYTSHVSYMNVSSHIWMRHVAYIALLHDPSHPETLAFSFGTCYVTRVRVTSHIHKSRNMCECVTSHVLHCCISSRNMCVSGRDATIHILHCCTSHVTCVNVSRRIYCIVGSRNNATMQ